MRDHLAHFPLELSCAQQAAFAVSVFCIPADFRLYQNWAAELSAYLLRHIWSWPRGSYTDPPIGATTRSLVGRLPRMREISNIVNGWTPSRATLLLPGGG